MFRFLLHNHHTLFSFHITCLIITVFQGLARPSREGTKHVVTF